MRAVLVFSLLFSLVFLAACMTADEDADDLNSPEFSQKTPSDPAEPEEGDGEGLTMDIVSMEAAEEAGDAEDESSPDSEDGEETEVDTGENGDEPMPDEESGTVEESNIVVLETTKGDIVIELHSDWAPLGVGHFKELVKAGFYDGAPWFRVLDGFVAQCGVSSDPAMNDEWGEKTIKDEPTIEGNTRGRVSYGMGGPNTRSTHIFINYGDNSSLDGQGFPAFAEVIEGMDVADSLTRCEFKDQGSLGQPGGMEMFKKMFPDADYITRAYFRKDG